MLIFGPYSAIPKDESFSVFNLSSPTQAVNRLPGLLVSPDMAIQCGVDFGSVEPEKSFDVWYFNYVLNDPTACSSMMMILGELYLGNKVYVCISDYTNDPYISMLNESFMKIIQTKYDIKYSIINEAEDFKYIPQDGCDFASVDGIYNFDQDRKRFMILSAENTLARGGTIPMADE